MECFGMSRQERYGGVRYGGRVQVGTGTAVLGRNGMVCPGGNGVDWSGEMRQGRQEWKG